MASPKVIKVGAAGALTQETTVQVGGVGSADKIPALDSGGKLDLTMMPTGVMDEVDSITASENLSSGDFVNLHDVGGSVRARKADGSANKPADGFVLAAVTSGQPADVYYDGMNSAVTGQTIGTVFLSDTTAGQATSTLATGAGHIHQTLGKAISPTAIRFVRGEPVTLA